MLRYDPTRLAASLRSAIADGAWNPTDHGRFLLRLIEQGMAVPVASDDETVMRDAMVGVHVSDMIVHAQGEIAEGSMPSYVLETAMAERPSNVVEAAFVRDLPQPYRLAA